MIRVTERVRLNEPDKMRDVVGEALAIADELELAEADRAAILPALVNLLAADHVAMEQVGLEAPAMRIPRNHG